MNIRVANDTHDIRAVQWLWREYAEEIGVDLSFQGFAQELASLPGPYSLPAGLLLIGIAGVDAAGCVGVRALGDRICEMKRLFVSSPYRAQGFGRALSERIIHEAKTIGYRAMVLDTLSRMTNAIRLYESLGFVRRGAYYETPLNETVFMELKL